MLDRRLFLRSAGAGILALSAWGKVSAAPLVVSRAGLVFTTIVVNGQDAKALIDTGGARGIQLSSPLAQRLGLSLSETGRTTQRYDGPRSVLATRLTSFAFAGRQFGAVEANVLPGDIESIGSQIGEPFDAILGWPFLGSQPFMIDYRGGTIDVGVDGPPGGLLLPLEPGRSQPVTAGELSGQPITFLVDTGAPHCNVDRSLAGDAAIGARVDLPFTIGGRSFAASFRVRDLGAMTRGLGARAVIGHAFLRDYRFVSAPDARAIRLV